MILQRAQGALIGLAIGDALGMPTQLLTRQQVAELFPILDDFLPGPPENAIRVMGASIAPNSSGAYSRGR